MKVFSSTRCSIRVYTSSGCMGASLVALLRRLSSQASCSCLSSSIHGDDAPIEPGRSCQLIHDCAQVAQQSHGDAPVAPDFGGGRISLDEFGVGIEDAAVAVAVVKALAEQQHHVGFPEFPGRAVQRAVGVPEAQGMQVVDEAPGLLDGEDGRAGGLGKSLKLGRLHGVAGRVAHDDHRTLGVGEEVGRLLDERRVTLRSPHVAVFLGQVRGKILLADGGLLEVDGQGQVDRAGSAAHCGAEGGSDEFRDAVLFVDQPRPLRNGSRHGDLVDFLEGCLTLFGEFGASGNENDGAFGGIDGRQAGDGVGEAGAAGEQGDGGLAGDAGVAIGHVHGRALVAGVDELDALIGSGVDQRQNGVAHDGENLLHALLFQASDKEVAPVQLRHRCNSFNRGNVCK